MKIKGFMKANWKQFSPTDTHIFKTTKLVLTESVFYVQPLWRYEGLFDAEQEALVGKKNRTKRCTDPDSMATSTEPGQDLLSISKRSQTQYAARTGGRHSADFQWVSFTYWNGM